MCLSLKLDRLEERDYPQDLARCLENSENDQMLVDMCMERSH